MDYVSPTYRPLSPMDDFEMKSGRGGTRAQKSDSGDEQNAILIPGGKSRDSAFQIRFPLLGLGAITFNIFCTLVAVLVLIYSDNVEIETWKGRLYLQPSVWLSITSTLANLSLSLALTQGVIVTFWRRAVNGTNLEDLHRCHGEGASFFDALSGIFNGISKRRNLAVALACILTSLSAIRSPLVQRTSIVASQSETLHGNMSVRVAKELDAFSALGQRTGRSYEISFLSENFTSIVRSFGNKESIHIEAPACGENCTTTIKGFGIKPDCYDVPKPSFPPMEGVGKRVAVFSVDVNRAAIDMPGLSFTVEAGSVDSNQAPSNATNINSCSLNISIVEYPVLIQNGKVVLQGSWKTDNSEPSRAHMNNGGGDVISGGLVKYLSDLFPSEVTARFAGGAGWEYFSEGILARTYVSVQGGTVRNPMEDMLDQTRELCFRTAIHMGRNSPNMPNATQIVPYQGHVTKTVYRSNFPLLAIAIMINFLAVLSVLPLYWGWWLLKRKVSLSPLEIANAFEAPLLDGVGGNATQEDIRKLVGRVNVRYNRRMEKL